ncbi:hypothetical protein ACLOJK_023451 [Asimina triloba]
MAEVQLQPSLLEVPTFPKGRGVVLILGVLDWWRERLPDLVETASVELEMSQRVVLEFFHSHSLKWFSSKEIFFWWCQGLTFFGALVAFERGEADVRQLGEASSSLAGAGSPAEGLTVREEGHLRKKRRLKKAIRKGQGPVMLQEEEEERLARREEVDFHTALDLSREEAHCSSLAVSLAEPANSRPAELVHLRLVELIYSRPVEPVDSMPVESVHVVDIDGDSASPVSGLLSEPSGRQRAATVRGFTTSQHKGYDMASRRPRGIENSCRNMAATPTPVGCGVLGATLGETSEGIEDPQRPPPCLDMGRWVRRAEALRSRAEEIAVGLLKDLDVAKFEQQKLLIELDAAKAEQDEALDHAKGVILAKKLQQRLPVCAYRSLTPRLPSTDCPTKVSVLGRRHRSQASYLGVKEQSCWRSLRSPEPAQLRADSSEGAEGDASSQASGPLSGESRALIISWYLCSDAHRQRGEFERTHYAHGGFVKALLEDAALYPKLDLSSLYGSS